MSAFGSYKECSTICKCPSCKNICIYCDDCIGEDNNQVEEGVCGYITNCNKYEQAR